MHAGSLVSIYQPNIGFETDSRTSVRPAKITATHSTPILPQSLDVSASTLGLASTPIDPVDGERRRRHKLTRQQKMKKKKKFEDAAAAEAGDAAENRGNTVISGSGQAR